MYIRHTIQCALVSNCRHILFLLSRKKEALVWDGRSLDVGAQQHSQTSLPSWPQHHASGKFHFWYSWGQNPDADTRCFVTVFRLPGFMIPSFTVHWPLTLSVLFLGASEIKSQRGLKLASWLPETLVWGLPPNSKKTGTWIFANFPHPFLLSCYPPTLALLFPQISFPTLSFLHRMSCLCTGSTAGPLCIRYIQVLLALWGSSYHKNIRHHSQSSQQKSSALSQLSTDGLLGQKQILSASGRSCWVS